MLKKLIKHGNSNALVLDRTILALLNVNERSVLKLRVEGEALIITANESVKSTDSLMLDIENIHSRRAAMASDSTSVGLAELRTSIEGKCRKSLDEIEKDPAAVEALEQWIPGTPNAEKLQKAFEEIFKKYQEDLKILQSKEFLQEQEVLLKKHKDNASPDDVINEMQALRHKYAPNLANMDKEMAQVPKKLGMPDNISTK